MAKLIRKNQNPTKGALGYTNIDKYIKNANILNALNTLKYLLEFKFNDGEPLSVELIAGIMGNGTIESGFDPNAWSAGKNYNGYWQNSKLIRDYMRANYGEDNTHDAYLKYLSEWLNSDGIKTRMNGLSYGKMSGRGYRAANHSTAEDSSLAFQDYYENNKRVGANERKAAAKDWKNYILANQSEYLDIPEKYKLPVLVDYNEDYLIQKPDALRIAPQTIKKIEYFK